MKKDTKLYFINKDSVICESLEDILDGAKSDGLTEITVLEAEPDKDTLDIIWCTHFLDCVEKSDCAKSLCSHYESKSGRGVCKNKGKLYTHGKEVTFKV